MNKLIQSEYIIKVPSDADRRFSHIYLTSKGKNLVYMHNKVHENIAQLFEENLSKKDVETLVTILNKMIVKIE